MTAAPSSCAGVVAKAPLKLPTGVRAADAITTLVMVHPLLGGRIRPGCAPGRRIAAGASGSPSSHKDEAGSTGMAGEELGHRPPDLGAGARCRRPCRHGRSRGRRLRAPAGARAERRGQRRRGDGVALAAEDERRRARSARGSTGRRGSASAPARSGCGSASRRAGPWRRRPASAPRRRASPRARRRGAPPAPSGSRRASFWNFSAACIGLTSAKSVWKSDTGTRPKAAPRPSSSRSAPRGALGADHRAEAAGDAAGRGEVPGRADRDQRRDVLGRAARRARPPACRPCSSRRPAPARRPARRARRAPGRSRSRAVGVEVEAGLGRAGRAPVHQQRPQALAPPASAAASGRATRSRM